jgi:hypothetical protein
MAARLREFREKSERRAVETLLEGQAAAARVAELTGGWASFLENASWPTSTAAT